MKKVVLLGDSIRLVGYGTKLAEYLGDDYEIFQSKDNGRFAFYTLRMIREDIESIRGADVIHWNNGAWDVCELFDDGEFTPLDIYVQTVKRIAGILLSLGKRVIFATTTPVNPKNRFNKNETVERYNAAVVPVLREMGVEINDLYALISEDIDKYIRHDDLIHLTDDGIDVAARQVADIIKKA